MKLNINIPEHLEQITKYIVGEMSPSETARFDELINVDSENIILINRMKNDWNRIGTMNNKKPNTENAWNKLHKKLNEENLMPTTQETPIRKISWVNWAAAAVAILVVSSTFLINGNWSNDVIITANTDLKTIVHSLADESTIYLSPNSEIRYKKSFGKKNRYITLKGEAFFEVTPNANLPFRIETHEAMVEVLGTSFTVKSNQKSNFEVIVETGTVSISTKENNKQEVIAQAGEAVSLINNNLSKTAAFENAYQNILSQRLHFKDENLSDIIKVINKNYNVNIILDVQGIENKRLTVTFYNNTIDSIIDVICATAGLEAHYADNTIILSKP